MDSKIVSEIKNTLGRFLQYYNLNRLDLAAPLFSKKRDTRLWVPDRSIDAKGMTAIKKALSGMQKKRSSNQIQRDVHIEHSPAFKIDSNKQLAYGTWDTYSFEIIETENGLKTEYYYTRLDGTFQEENGSWKFRELDWWEVMSFVPWDYNVEQDEGLHGQISQIPLPPIPQGDITGQDFYEIQNVLTRFVQNNRRYAMDDLFAQSEAVSFSVPFLLPDAYIGHQAVSEAMDKLASMEKENLGKYVFVPTVSTPVIELSPDGITARGQWLSLMHTVEGEAFNIKEAPYNYIRRIGVVTCNFIKENGAWKMLTFDAAVLLTLPYLVYDPNNEMGRRYQRMGQTENNWRPAPPKMGTRFPDDMAEVETLMPYWVNAYRRGDYENHIREHCFNDDYETVFNSRLAGRMAPPLIGTEAWLERFTMPTFDYHHQQPSYHTGMCPVIDMSMDGKYATVQYFDLNTSPYIPKGKDGKETTPYDITRNWSADNCGMEHVPCYTQLCKYEHHFAKVGNEWKHFRVDFEAILTLPDFETMGKASRGWAGSVTDFKYPALWQKYEYSPIRKIDAD